MEDSKFNKSIRSLYLKAMAIKDKSAFRKVKRNLKVSKNKLRLRNKNQFKKLLRALSGNRI